MTIETETSQRRLLLEGAYNVRDIGGYATSAGRKTRWRSIVRADRPTRLTVSDQQILLDYGIHTVLDMRFPKEVHKAPNNFAQSPTIIYKNLPIFKDDDWEKSDKVSLLLEQNIFSLDGCQSQLYKIFETIASQPTCILVHCAVGKDRTGLIIALLLSLVNVPLTTIAADYALSAEYLEPLYVGLRAKAKAAGHDVEKYENLLASEPETILETLAYVQTRYNGTENYLRTIGLNDAQLDQLRQLLLDD
jgi:protein-tyrosine phosphatase